MKWLDKCPGCGGYLYIGDEDVSCSVCRPNKQLRFSTPFLFAFSALMAIAVALFQYANGTIPWGIVAASLLFVGGGLVVRYVHRK